MGPKNPILIIQAPKLGSAFQLKRNNSSRCLGVSKFSQFPRLGLDGRFRTTSSQRGLGFRVSITLNPKPLWKPVVSPQNHKPSQALNPEPLQKPS